MSYDGNELSVQSGAALELYDFAQGPVEWHYTSAELLALNIDGVDYTSAPIERSEIESTTERARNALKLTVPRTFPIAELFRVAPPSEVISVTLRRIHRADAEGSPTDVIPVWMGRVLSCSFSGGKASLQCEPISISLARTGLHRLFQIPCPYVLYGAGCNLNKASFAHATTVDGAPSGNLLTVASTDGAYSYSGGFVEWINDDGITERRFIEAQAGEALTLMNPFAGIAASDAVTIYPGCDHSMTTCNDVFNNALNHGGFAYFPPDNPFTKAVF